MVRNGSVALILPRCCSCFLSHFLRERELFAWDREDVFPALRLAADCSSAGGTYAIVSWSTSS